MSSRFSSFLKEKFLETQRFSVGIKILLISPCLFWLSLFNFSKYVPVSARPPIDHQTLAQLDYQILFGFSLLEWPRTQLPQSTLRNFLDLFFATAYLLHFIVVWFYGFVLYLFYRKKKTKNLPILEPWTFFFCWGILNSLAVLTQLCWPTTPPWYTEIYGGKTPNYSMVGDPGGLSNADNILTVQLFETLYGQSPVVFGSFPSLHGAWPLMMTLFAPKNFAKIAFGTYSLWVWWAALYLKHHYLIDLIGGATYVIISYMIGLSVIRVAVSHPIWRTKIYNRMTHIENEFEIV